MKWITLTLLAACLTNFSLSENTEEFEDDSLTHHDVEGGYEYEDIVRITTNSTEFIAESCVVPFVSNGKIGSLEMIDGQTHFQLKEGTRIEDLSFLFLRCNEKYEPFGTTNREEKIICSRGEWDRKPRCDPASCRKRSPQFNNAYQLTTNSSHGAKLLYSCIKDFRKSQVEDIKCNFGDWTGTPPVCKDTRCDVHSLDLIGVKKEVSKRYYSHLESYTPVCENGYSAVKKPAHMCFDGEWNGNFPLCEPDTCSIYNVNKGKITENFYREACFFFVFSCKNWTEPVEVEKNQLFSTGSYLYITCDEGYTLHGKGRNNVLITCSGGQWNPRLVCLRTGMIYHEEVETTPKAKTRVDSSRPSTTRPMASTVQPSDTRLSQQPVVVTDMRPPTEPVEDEDTLEAFSDRNVNCSCTYINLDPNLVGYAGTKRLQSKTDIKVGCKVRFHCFPMGFYRLIGDSEITCKECRTWNSSEYPQCVFPEFGDTAIMIAANLVRAEMPGGAIGIYQGSALRLFCIPGGKDIRSRWKSIPQTDNVLFYNIVGLLFKFIQVLEITDIRAQNSGTYECAVRGYRSNFLEIQVITPDVSCPIFSEEGNFTVHYDRGQAFNSTATFSCKNPSDMVVGCDILTCMFNGQWSCDPPRCISISGCPPILKPEDSQLLLDPELKFYRIGQLVTFSCPPGHILSSNVMRITCKGDSKWSTKEIPHCITTKKPTSAPDSTRFTVI